MMKNKNFRTIAFLAIIVWLTPFGTAAAQKTPVLIPGAQIYDRSSDEFSSALIIDAATGKRLYAYKPDLKWPAASLTKLMAAMVFVKQKPDWSKNVSLKAQDEVGGGRLRVETGSTMTIRDMFYSSIVASANNTTMALARLSGLSNKTFVAKMNQKAKDLGMSSSVFYEPSGMDPKNTLTAWDAYKMAKTAFSDQIIKKAASTAFYQFKIKNKGELKKISNTNNLLTKDPDTYVYGGKTGFLYESRNNLIVKLRSYPISPDKPILYVIVLGSPTKEDSFTTAKSLANWAYKAYSWQSTGT